MNSMMLFNDVELREKFSLAIEMILNLILYFSLNEVRTMGKRMMAKFDFFMGIKLVIWEKDCSCLNVSGVVKIK